MTTATVATSHTPAVKRVLKRAGLSEQSELTADQLGRAKKDEAKSLSPSRAADFILHGKAKAEPKAEAPSGNGKAKASSSEKAEPKSEKKKGAPRASKYSEEDRALCEAAMKRANTRAAKPMKTKIRPRELVLINKGLGRNTKPSDVGSVEVLDKVARGREESPEALTALCKKIGDPIVRPRIAAAVLAEMQAGS